MTDISVSTTSYGVDKRSWLLGTHGTDPGSTPNVTLDVSAFTKALHYPDGWIRSGTPLGKITSNNMYGPYEVTEEVQTLTVGGSGLTSFTLTYSGQTTGSIAAAATAADVQAALEALSNLAPGDVVVTGGTGGPWTVAFGGTLVDTNVAAITTTPTGGSGTVTGATTTAGGAEGSDGLDVCRGLLFAAVKVPDNGADVGGGLFVHGMVRLAKLPRTLDANGQSDLKLIHFA